MATKKFKKVTVYLYSQIEPLVFEDGWFYVTPKDLSDTRVEEFIPMGPNFVRKTDISKIFVEDVVREVEDKKEKKDENDKGN